MRGIDIIEAMGEIDPELIRDAKMQARPVPLWLKGLATAACFVCITGITLLSLGRLLGHTDTTGGAMSPVPPASPLVLQPASAEEESAVEPSITPPPQTTPTPVPDVVYQTDTEVDDSIIYSSQYGLSLRVPIRYQNEVSVDADHTLFYNGNSVNLYEAAFIFQDSQNFAPGLVWGILPVPHDISASSLENELLHALTLAEDNYYRYVLLYPEPESQYDYNDPESVYSYMSHISAGLSILEDFLAVNSLDGSELALAEYENVTLELERAWSALMESWLEPYAGDTVVLENSLGLSLEVPASLSGDIAIDPEGFTFIEPVSESISAGGGFIWSIQAMPWEEYYETFDRQDREFTLLREPQDGLALLGRTEEYAYVIQYPTEGRLIAEDTESAVAYARYEQLGRRIIQDFFDRNSIEGNPDWTLPQ